MELLIVLVIVSLLVSVAIPAYQRARNAALISSMVDQLVSYAKACVVINASGVGERPQPPSMSPVRGGIQIHQGCERAGEGAILKASWGDARAAGIDCYGDSSTVSSSSVSIRITDDNIIKCRFED